MSWIETITRDGRIVLMNDEKHLPTRKRRQGFVFVLWQNVANEQKVFQLYDYTYPLDPCCRRAAISWCILIWNGACFTQPSLERDAWRTSLKQEHGPCHESINFAIA